MTTLAVVVPTYLRPASLERCLRALADQHRAPDEVVVVTSPGDESSAGVVATAAPRARLVRSAAPGVLAAMAAGTAATSAAIVAFTDDDAEPAPEWVERLVALVDAPLVGAAGGRDVVTRPDGTVEDAPRTRDVGRVTAYGRHVGGHHLGEGPVRDVAFLKGVNAAYRRHALGFPHGLRGEGAQAHLEIAMGRFARARGYRLVYDPSLTVVHRPAQRQGEDQRDAPSQRAVSDAAYNLVVAIGGVRGVARVAYATLLGDGGTPGLGRALVALVRGDDATVRRTRPAVRGTLAGGWALLSGRGVTYETVGAARGTGDATASSSA